MKEQLLKLQEVFAKAKGERVDLKDIKTLDTLEDKSYSLVRNINSAYDDYSYYITGEDDIVSDIKEVENDVKAWQGDLDSANVKVKELEEEKKNLIRGLKSWEEEVKLSKNNIKDLTAQLKKRNSDLKKFKKDKDITLKKYKKLESEGDKLAANFKKNIKDFKSSAKALGVKVSTSDYENALKDLEGAGGSI